MAAAKYKCMSQNRRGHGNNQAFSSYVKASKAKRHGSPLNYFRLLSRIPLLMREKQT